jgi:hypothetical protein
LIIFLLSAFYAIFLWYPENMVQCYNQGNMDFVNYIVVATMLKNKRRYVREWIEFHLMMGVSHFIFYDHGSNDRVEEVLEPYIQKGIVTFFSWPPKDFPNEDWGNDRRLKTHFYDNMKKCYENKEAIHIHVPCQVAAFDDAIRRTRGKARWMAGIDVDEFYYIPENSTLWKSHPNSPLVGAFKNLEKYHIVAVLGQHFGTSGWLSPPRRDDEAAYAQLITKTHLHHALYNPDELVKAREHVKPFVNPYCVGGNGLHYYEDGGGSINWKDIHHNTYDDDNAPVVMNHYLWPSYIENLEKRIANGNPGTGYDEDYDRFLNKEVGSTIDYILPRLEERIKIAVKDKPPADGHGDDWDYRLELRQNSKKTNPDLCVVLWKPSHIGLARHALSSVINYFYRVENTINYNLILLSGNKYKDELKSDFPIDLLVESEEQLNDSCPANIVLRLDESTFARWEKWPLEKPAIKAGLELLSNDNLSIDKISLTDSSNLMTKWTRAEDKVAVDYRINSGQKLKEALLMKKSVIMNDEREGTFEICFHEQDFCQDHIIKGLFEIYSQERMYGYEPGFI